MNTNSLNSLAADLALFDNYQFALDSMDYMPTEQDYQDWMKCLREETKSQLKVGTKVMYGEWPGTVVEICTGVLSGMAVIRVPGGRTCVCISEIEII